MTTATTDAPQPRPILSVDVADMDEADALDMVLERARRRDGAKVAFCNAHFANVAHENERLADALNDFLVLPDGIGVDIASRLLRGRPFRANLNGTDFTPALFAKSATALHVGLLGAAPGIAERAAEIWRERFPRHRFRVLGDGFFDAETEDRILEALAADPVDILLVAMGNPRQELWIATHIDGRHAGVAMGIGALFDFTAGKVERAPDWMRKARIEWVYRLLLEPGRLWRRYVVGNPLFLIRILRSLSVSRRRFNQHR